LDQVNYWWLLEPYMKHSAVRSILEQEGYSTYFFATGWDFTDIRDGDHYLRPFPIMFNDLLRAYVEEVTNQQVLQHLHSNLVSIPTFDTHRKIISYQFEMLPKVAENPGPKFVFAHIINPHPPFVYYEDGSPVNPDYPYSLSYAPGLFGSNVEYEASYIAQLIYDNGQILKMIDDILANASTPPIIILQGDHGPGVYANFDSLSHVCLYERYSILNAYYFPDPQPASISMDISPVNSFRLILTNYLGLDYPPLPEKRFFSTGQDFYTFQDVTSQTENACTNLSTSQP
jgi:hypothetical protein